MEEGAKGMTRTRDYARHRLRFRICVARLLRAMPSMCRLKVVTEASKRTLVAKVAQGNWMLMLLPGLPWMDASRHVLPSVQELLKSRLM